MSFEVGEVLFRNNIIYYFQLDMFTSNDVLYMATRNLTDKSSEIGVMEMMMDGGDGPFNYVYEPYVKISIPQWKYDGRVCFSS